MLSFWY